MSALLLGATGAGIPASIDLTENLVAHYLLNNNADDSHGIYDGTPTNGVDFQGDVADFNILDSNVNMGQTTPLNTFNGSYTVSLWVTLNDLSVSQYLYGFRRDSSFGESVWNTLYVSTAGNLRLLLRDDLIFHADTVTSLTLALDTLYNITLTVSPTAISHYVDGVLIDSFVNTITSFSNPTLDSLIGGSTHKIDNNAEYINDLTATMSNFRIYSDVKDQAFITALYEEGYYPKPLPLPTKDGLVAHYPLTGTAEDAHGEGGNESGTEYNSVAFVDEIGFKDEGKVLHNNGVDSYLSNGAFSWTTSKSFSFWASGDFDISNEYSSNASNRISVYSLGGNVYSRSRDGTVGSGDYVYRQLNDVVPVDSKYHIVFIYATTMDYRLYINGVYYDNTNFTIIAQSGVLNTSANGLAIGRHDYNGTIFYTAGLMSDMKVYDRIITQTDVDNIMNNSVPTDTISEYPFDTDFSDTKDTFNLTSANALISESRDDSIAIFDGVNDYIHMATPPYTNFATGTCTLSVWAYIDSSVGGTPFSFDHNEDTGYIYGSFTNTRIGLGIREDSFGAYQTTYIYDTFPEGWYHISITFNNGVVEISINDNQWSIGGLSNLAPTTINSFAFGANLNKGGANLSPLAPEGFYTGKLSNFRCYARVLDSTELTALYNELSEPTDGLIAHYPLTKEWRALDAWVAYDGTEQVTPTYVNDAEFGSVFQASLTSFINRSGFQIGGNWTFSGWVKLLSNGGISQSIFFDGTYSFRASQVSGSNIIGITHSAVADYKFGTTPFPYGQWVFMTFTGDSATFVNLYLDTVYKSSITASIKLPVNWIIGSNDSNQYTNGKAKDFRFYNRILLDTEITDIYNYEKNFRPIDIDDGLVAYYPLAKNSLDNYHNQYDGVDTAMTYDGTSASFGDINARIDMNMGTTHDLHGISMWVYNATEIDSNYALEFLGQPNQLHNYTSFSFGSSSGTLLDETLTMLNWNTSSDTLATSSSSAMTDIIPAGWNHIVIVWNTTTSRYEFYLNGVEATMIYYGSTIGAIIKCDPKFGGRGIVGYEYTGKLSKVRTYTTKAPTAEQVEVIYNTEKGDFV